MDFIKRKKIIGIIPFIFVFVIIYLSKLNSVPSGFYIDEASPIYNAYSILLTGKDEYGKSFPLAFRFFGNYNPPLFTYFLIPFVYIFGLNIFTARFVSVLMGFASVLPFYLILKDSKVLKEKTGIYLSAVLFVLTPWLVLHSRTGTEISTALLFYSISIYLLWKSISDKKYILWAIVILSISTYISYTLRFLMPLTLVGYFLVFYKTLANGSYRKHIVTGLLLAIIIQIPNLYLLTTPAFFPKSGLFSEGAIVSQTSKLTSYLPYEISYIMAFTREFLSQYFTYFSPRSLFFQADPDLQRSIPELSVFYFWMIVPYTLGLIVVWKRRNELFIRYLLALLVIAPIPAALTHDPFSTHRAMPLFFPMMIIIALGIDRIIFKWNKGVILVSSSVLLVLSVLLLWRSYFVLLPYERASVWGYGYEQLAQEIQVRSGEHFILDQSRAKPHYSYLLFYLKYPPQTYHMETDSVINDNYYYIINFNQYRKFANIETRDIFWEEDVYSDLVLVGDELAISPDQASEHHLEKIFEIKLPDGRPVFAGYKTNPRVKCQDDWRETCTGNI
jgi:4-amino-4-deoxy-L-arabinose transferase-like glycosyltransferase